MHYDNQQDDYDNHHIVSRNMRETTQWCVFQEKICISIQSLNHFPCPLASMVIAIYNAIVCYNDYE